ncbi:MAG TPA: P-II family nitrogen regulator [Spirochaetia bacterium]|nr:P-II family nitrogen regulator [Spirochaetia bacterium]
MKEIYAIIRPNKINATKEALGVLGFPGMTAWKVTGRGKQKGIQGEVCFPGVLSDHNSDGGMKYVPKRLVYLTVDDADVPLVVAVITKINRTGQIGDGRIFVCPVEEVVRVRTGEAGQDAI